MELKDVILSTLAEMEEVNLSQDEIIKEVREPNPKIKKEKTTILSSKTQEIKENSPDGELIFLNSMRERLLVLFEGFQAPNNTNIEAKIDMTLNFLEYILANIDTRVDELKKAKR
ncbi:MAG: hypothetical protein COA33_007400 [Fluviicola sp.]|nr:hypothetical protein [Fluviicola sp.]